MSTKPILELDTLAPERPTVKIKTPEYRDGKFYEIATLDDLSINDRATLGRLQQKVAELEPEAKAFLTDPAAVPDPEILNQFEQVVDEFLPLVIVGLPHAVIRGTPAEGPNGEPIMRGGLNLPQKEALMQVFTEASPPEMRTKIMEAQAEADQAAKPKRTQAKRSQGSKRSTAARPKAGSK